MPDIVKAGQNNRAGRAGANERRRGMEAERKHDDFVDELKKGGPLAFPFVVEGHVMCTGMTMRDHFAGEALSGIVNGEGVRALMHSARLNQVDPAFVAAKVAFNYADAMLVVREQPAPPVQLTPLQELLVTALNEMVEQHTNGIAGISQPCIERARAALAAAGAA